MDGVKGLLLCGGEGTRLRPITKAVNKHMIRIGGQLMLDYPIQKFVEAGIDDIHVVIGGEHFDAIVKYLGSGKAHGAKFTYSMQDEAGGIAQAIGLAESYIGDDKMVVLLGDNLFGHTIQPEIHDFCNSDRPSESRIFFTKSDMPKRFGCLAYSEEGIPSDIIEKPEVPPSNDIIVGIYMYTPDVFDVIRDLKPSGRGELEITDVNRYYMKNNMSEFVLHPLEGWWTDCGTMETIARAEELVRTEGIGSVSG